MSDDDSNYTNLPFPTKLPFLFPFFKFKRPTQKFHNWYKYYVLFTTFLAYLSYHASRKPITIVKAQLHHNCSDDSRPHPDTNSTTWCDWKPFDQDNYKILFGELDYAYLGSYAISMFFSGWVAERMNLRYFLSLGMVLSGIFTVLFGMGYVFKIHFFGYYMMVQVISGIFQSSGWPGVVTLVGNWFGKGKRGLIMGIWNSHTSFGNIIGSLIAAEFADTDWALSFVIPGIMILFMGIVLFLTVVPHPEELGYDGGNGGESVGLLDEEEDCDIEVEDEEIILDAGNILNQENILDEENILTEENILDILDEALESGILEPRALEESSSEIIFPDTSRNNAISFFKALCIPGVIEFSFCLFFAKLVSYTFLFWLPYYLSNELNMSAKESGDFSTIFDIGGIIGGIIAGSFSDSTGKRALTVAVMLIFGCVVLPFFQIISSVSSAYLVTSLFITGLLVNGPYALITTAVSADLGTHPSLNGNSAALATVTSIIDGTGSLGAALGPYLVGLISSGKNWAAVFKMLFVCNILALVMLTRLVKKEIVG